MSVHLAMDVPRWTRLVDTEFAGKVIMDVRLDFPEVEYTFSDETYGRVLAHADVEVETTPIREARIDLARRILNGDL